MILWWPILPCYMLYDSFINLRCSSLQFFEIYILIGKGTVQRKLTGAKSGIKRKALNCWYLIFTFKGNLLLKSQKTVSAAYAKICGSSISMGCLLQITDGRNKFPTAIRKISNISDMPIFPIILWWDAYCSYKSPNRFTAWNASKLSAMNVNGLSAISSLQHAPYG
jgi:hypothetical protein